MKQSEYELKEANYMIAFIKSIPQKLNKKEKLRILYSAGKIFKLKNEAIIK